MLDSLKSSGHHGNHRQERNAREKQRDKGYGDNNGCCDGLAKFPAAGGEMKMLGGHLDASAGISLFFPNIHDQRDK